MIEQSTICAITTPPGTGAIATIRLTGENSFEIAEQIFSSPIKGKKICEQKANTLHFGSIHDQGDSIDDVVMSLFRAPHSFTGEDVVEISCHGSVYIQQQILQLLIKNGARLARPGEFTQRAFLNGKMDLSQAEAVADLIASQSAAAHSIALKQMKGGISGEIKLLRSELLSFISLIELELDFGEEDVEFVNRDSLLQLVGKIHQLINNLTDSFQYGNAIKNGIPVAIIGAANVGKSTLLNLLLREERAIVSEIAGTTRDSIEDVVIIDGVQFRFIDTAGIRSTTDTIENLGIERTFVKIDQANIVLILIDATDLQSSEFFLVNQIEEKIQSKDCAIIINKIDIAPEENCRKLIELAKGFNLPPISISAKNKINTDELVAFLMKSIHKGKSTGNEVIISNVRHFEALTKADESIVRVIEGLKKGISGDFLSQDIRECLHYLGEITGEISTDEVLGNIFRNFCIGK
jgi:tRNA modification GTPase